MQSLAECLVMPRVVCRPQEELDEVARRERLSEASVSLSETLPENLRRATAEQLRHRVDPRLARQAGAWNHRMGNLVLLGDSGVGKTSAAAFLVKRAAWQWAKESADGLALARRIRWATARQLGMARREARLGESVTALEKAKRSSLLVLDDVGQDANRDDLFDVLDHRYVSGAPTIVTTGLQLDEIAARYGEEVRRRIMTCGGRPTTTAEAWGAA